jgi:K+-transporting ATPase KdpF subunit
VSGAVVMGSVVASTVDIGIGLGLGVAVLCFLFVVLLRPERF